MLASARSMPSPSAATVGPEAGGAHQGVQHEIAVGLGDQLDEALGAAPAPRPPVQCSDAGRRRPGRPARRVSTPNARACSSSSSPLDPAASPTTSSASLRATTSRACVPIEPVEPTIRILRIRPSVGERIAAAGAARATSSASSSARASRADRPRRRSRTSSSTAGSGRSSWMSTAPHIRFRSARDAQLRADDRSMAVGPCSRARASTSPTMTGPRSRSARPIRPRPADWRQLCVSSRRRSRPGGRRSTTWPSSRDLDHSAARPAERGVQLLDHCLGSLQLGARGTGGRRWRWSAELARAALEHAARATAAGRFAADGRAHQQATARRPGRPARACRRPRRARPGRRRRGRWPPRPARPVADLIEQPPFGGVGRAVVAVHVEGAAALPDQSLGGWVVATAVDLVVEPDAQPPQQRVAAVGRETSGSARRRGRRERHRPAGGVDAPRRACCHRLQPVHGDAPSDSGPSKRRDQARARRRAGARSARARRRGAGGRPTGAARAKSPARAEHTWPPPRRLAAYWAASAARSSWLGRARCPGRPPPGHETASRPCRAPRAGSSSAAAATLRGYVEARHPRQHHANSSPESRPTQAPGRAARRLDQRLAHAPERPVAGVVAALVVDRLELVDVADQRRRLAALAPTRRPRAPAAPPARAGSPAR